MWELSWFAFKRHFFMHVRDASPLAALRASPTPHFRGEPFQLSPTHQTANFPQPSCPTKPAKFHRKTTFQRLSPNGRPDPRHLQVSPSPHCDTTLWEKENSGDSLLPLACFPGAGEGAKSTGWQLSLGEVVFCGGWSSGETSGRRKTRSASEKLVGVRRAS